MLIVVMPIELQPAPNHRENPSAWLVVIDDPMRLDMRFDRVFDTVLTTTPFFSLSFINTLEIRSKAFNFQLNLLIASQRQILFEHHRETCDTECHLIRNLP